MSYTFPVINVIKTGENIERLMKANKITVKDLQKIFGFDSPQAIYKWKWGTSLPSIDNLVVLSQIFKTPIDKILIITNL